MLIIKESIHYCCNDNNTYKCFSKSALGTEMHGVTKSKIIKVKAIENLSNIESVYWGYWDNKKNEFVFIFQSKIQLQMCSPSFFKDDIERGEGLILNVIIEPLIEE